ncbi:catalase domain-containing protein [Trichoderma austrokoningii]
MLHLDLINTLKDLFGRFDHVRPSHARGIFVTGSFTPTAEAKQLSTAPHFDAPSTPVIARFSLFTGIPDLPSNTPQATPHGFAVRFLISDDAKTDIVCQSSVFFPGGTGDEILAVFRSFKDNTAEEYAKDHPAAASFILEDRKVPKTFGTQSFYSINAFKFVNASGETALIRYRWIPVSGRHYLTQSEWEAKGPNFLFDELPDVFTQGSIIFKLVAQVAGDEDVTNDCTQIWPEDRRLVELGTLTLDKVAGEDDLPPQKETIVYNVFPGVQGVEPSDDPIIAIRSRVYQTSGQTRRDAKV